MNRLLTLFLACSSLALAAGNLNIVVGGQAAPDPAITVGGKTYVPLSVFRLLNVATSVQGSTLTLGTPVAGTIAPGGSTQRASLEGCIGETLFNGVWRLKVTKLEQLPPNPQVGPGPGWGATIEVRNGTRVKTQIHDTGLTSIDMVTPDGNALKLAEHDAEEKLIYKDVIQSGVITYRLGFYFADALPAAGLPRPSKLLVQFDPQKLTAGYLKEAKVAYTTPTPSFRVRLDCQK